MKIKSFMLTSLTALAFTACSSSSDDIQETVPGQPRYDVSFVAGMPEVLKGTRTSFDVTQNADGSLTYTPLWSIGEKLSVLYADNKAASYAGTNTTEAVRATFKHTGSSNPLTAGSTIVAVNKDFVFEGGNISSRGIDIDDGVTTMTDSYTSGVITTGFKSEQLIESASKIDDKSEILVSKPVTLGEDSSAPVPLEFKRLNGIIRVNVMAKGDNTYPLAGVGIKEIQLTTESTADDFGGGVKISVNGGTITKTNSTKVSVKSSTNGNIGSVGADTPVYISVLPTTINKGSSFKIYFLTADGRTYERILKASDKTGNVIVPEGKVTTFNVSFGDANLKVINNPKTIRK